MNDDQPLMTVAEMKQEYDGQWVLIDAPELDADGLHIVRGKVIAHSPNRDDIYKLLLSTDSKSFAVEFLGEIPADLAVVL